MLEVNGNRSVGTLGIRDGFTVLAPNNRVSCLEITV